jgi:hypothetical protein
MKRLIFLFCALVMLFDLADDGGLGKVKFVAPQPSANSAVSSASLKSTQVHLKVSAPPPNLWDIRIPCRGQTICLAALHCLNLIGCHFLGSSGGLPL